MRSLFIATLLAALGGIAIAVGFKPPSVEAQLLHLRVEQALPEYAADVGRESAEIQALFVDYARDPVLLAKARLALLRHPDMARRILPIYGDWPVFQEVLSRYGEDVLLPIQYFLDNDVTTLRVMMGMDRAGRAILDTMRQWWSSDGAAPAETGAGAGQGGETSGVGAPADAAGASAASSSVDDLLTPERRGEYAVQFLHIEGYDFLGQFVLEPGGKPAWLQTERVLEGINAVFAGGLRGLEGRFRRDEPASLGDVGWAAADVAIGAGAFKLLRMGRAGAATAGAATGRAAAGSSMTFSQRSAALGASLWRGTVVGARLAKYGAPVVLAYVAVRHPSVLNAMFGQVAEKLGVPVPVAQALGWALVLLPLILLGRLLLRPLAAVFAGLAALLRLVGRGLGGPRGTRRQTRIDPMVT